MRKISLLIFVLFFNADAAVGYGVSVKGGIGRLINTVVDVIVSEKNNKSEEFLCGNRRESSDGTGFIIDENGFIVTNCHVIDATEKIKIVLFDGSEYVAKIVGRDERSDIALLKIDVDTKLPAVQFADSDKAEIGDPVLAIGNPFGFGKTVTSGIVSYKGRNLSEQIVELGAGGDLVSYLQTDASVNYGNSGGPLFLHTGEVVGMITVFFSDGAHSTGINFAIPSNTLKKVIKQLRDFGKMRRSWIGISVSPLDKSAATALGLGKRHGCVINKVETGSPSSIAGIRAGDVLLSINDEEISENSNLEYMLNNLPIDRVIPVQIIRRGVEQKLSVKVATRKDDDFFFGSDDDSPSKKDIPYAKIDGIDIGVADLNQDLRKNFEIQETVKGVLVSNAGDTELSMGNVIVSVNQINVTTVKELEAVLQSLAKDEGVRKCGKVALYIFDPTLRRSDFVAVPFKAKTPDSSNVVIPAPKVK